MTTNTTRESDFRIILERKRALLQAQADSLALDADLNEIQADNEGSWFQRRRLRKAVRTQRHNAAQLRRCAAECARRLAAIEG